MIWSKRYDMNRDTLYEFFLQKKPKMAKNMNEYVTKKSTNVLSIVFENWDLYILLIRATHTLYLVMIITGSLLKKTFA